MPKNNLHTLPTDMTPPTLHLMIAKKVANELGINISGQFLLGAISPDAVFARMDYSKEDVSKAHFRIESVKKSWALGIEKFNSTDDIFLKGYCIHIMSDVLWLSGLYTDVRNEFKDLFSTNEFNSDLHFIEKWLSRNNEYSALWNAISGAKISNINYYVSPGEVELFKLQKSKSIKYDKTIDSAKYLSINQIYDFINKASSRIAKELKK